MPRRNRLKQHHLAPPYGGPLAYFPPLTPVSLRRLALDLVQAPNKQRTSRSVNRKALTTSPGGSRISGRSAQAA